jgi:hypothetical protein
LVDICAIILSLAMGVVLALETVARHRASSCNLSDGTRTLAAQKTAHHQFASTAVCGAVYH